MKSEILRMERVTYKQDDKTLLRDLEFYILEGEIVGLFPWNLYGLPEFLQILSGKLPLYDGYIYYKERMVESYRGAAKNPWRICMIQEKSSLVEGQSVLTNVFILRQGFGKELIQKGLLKRQFDSFLEEIGMELSPDVYVENLTTYERIVVEMLRAVMRGCGLIVLYEVDTLINEDEYARLYQVMQYYAKKGHAFLCISTKFENLSRICERIAVMSNGKIMKSLWKPQYSKELFAETAKQYKDMEKRCMRKREMEFEVKNLSGVYLKEVSFSVAKGECIALRCRGLERFQELSGWLTGSTEGVSGEIYLSGNKTKLTENREIAVIAEKPAESMIFYEMNYRDNLCFTMDHRVRSIWGNTKIKKSVQKEYEKMLGKKILFNAVDKLTELEKIELVYGRIWLQNPKVVFCIQPFKGMDAKHCSRIWELLEMLLKKGTAVVILLGNAKESLPFVERVLDR